MNTFGNFDGNIIINQTVIFTFCEHNVAKRYVMMEDSNVQRRLVAYVESTMLSTFNDDFHF